MEFNKSRVYTSVNADELKEGDKVIVAMNLADLRKFVIIGGKASTLIEVASEDNYGRFIVKGVNFPLSFLVERKENCTNCRLCNGSIKDDPTQVCENYEPKVEPPANCETCSKADTDRCPVPNPHKETGCGRWEAKSARVCENCRNLECHGKDNNWCEVREIKLSDEAIKKNTCGYLELVKAEKPYHPFANTDELIKVWCETKCPAQNHRERGLTMPLIWVRSKFNKDHKGVLINNYFGEYVELGKVQCFLERLFGEYTFLDGSPCGVEK